MLSLSEFYRSVYAPIRLASASRKTTDWYESFVRVWSRATGDPSLDEITDEMVAGFVAGVARTRSRSTANSYRRGLLTLLNFAGPRSRYVRDARGLITEVPWCRPVREARRVPRILSGQEVLTLVRSSRYATLPARMGVNPAAWWRALDIVLLACGARIGAILAVREDDVDWSSQTLTLRPEPSKTYIEQRVPLGRRALRALERMRGSVGPERLLFEWPHDRSTLWRQFRRMQYLGGLKRPCTFHDLRKTCATRVAERHGPAAAQMLLGHTTFGTTAKHYVDWDVVLRKAVEDF